MSKGTTDDITSRKLKMILHARNHVDAMKDDKPTAEPKRETVSLEEALKTEMLVNQALINLLVAKGLITQDELLEEIKELETQASLKGKPWRRCWARTLDTMLLAYPIWVFFILPIFPQFVFYILESNVGYLVIGVFILPFIMLGEACILGSTGTTFGKWLLNITIVRKDYSGSITFLDALKRSILLLIKGLAFGLPLISLFSMGFAAGRIRRNGTASWDDSISAEVHCYSLKTWKVCVAVFTIISLSAIYLLYFTWVSGFFDWVEHISQ